MESRTKLYSVFHLNMMFSSIEESDRPAVIDGCYWPLLRLIDGGKPLAIEASGQTLEIINNIDPKWVETLRNFIRDDKCEFIGSGYAQIIGPLVPHEVNLKNLSLGLEVYENLLGVRPQLALVNEMAYSPGLVDIYLQSGYAAIIMDWANPYSQNRHIWDKDWRFFPQKARGLNGQSINLIWLDTVPFQRFQRYVHGEIDVSEMIDFVSGECGELRGAFPLYGNDAEIFDYRPGRFETEPVMGAESEWDRIRLMLERIASQPQFQLVHPTEVLGLMSHPNAGHELTLQTPNDPAPVKKQPKYNLVRWAASGRDDVWANTACWRVFNKLSNDLDATDDHWRKLCILWGSDFRTHITEKRWRNYNFDLADSGAYEQGAHVFEPDANHQRLSTLPPTAPFSLERDKRHITITSPTGTLMLKLLRGLAIEAFWPKGDDQSVYRTLPQGYFSDINWAADFYSGHLTGQVVGRPQITDLEKVDPLIFFDPDHEYVDVEAHIDTLAGPLRKRVRMFASKPRVEVSYRIDWIDDAQGAVHFGNITLNPAGFDRTRLFYATHNGGCEWEKHNLAAKNVNHMASPNFLLSCRAGMGMTEGKFMFGDDKRQVLVECPRDVVAMMPLLRCEHVDTWKGPSFFCRLALSAREIDDTARLGPRLPVPGRSDYFYALTALTGAEI